MKNLHKSILIILVIFNLVFGQASIIYVNAQEADPQPTETTDPVEPATFVVTCLEGEELSVDGNCVEKVIGESLPLATVYNSEPNITVIAHKVMCESEEYLPNWASAGSFTTNFDANTAQTFVTASNGKCWLESGWDFEWAPDGTTNPGDSLTGPAGGSWNLFGPTDANGVTSINIPLDSDGELRVWIREVLQPGYIPFSFETTGEVGVNPGNNYSAEIYCDNKAGNYDNYDEVINSGVGENTSNLIPGETYHCIAFNAPIEEVAPICDPEVNLVQNAGFEDPEVTHSSSWGVFASGFAGLEWLIEWVDIVVGQPNPANLELQENGISFGGTASEGDQWAELDSDWYQPGTNGSSIESASARILQDIPTNPGYTYTVSYKTSSRPDADVADSKIDAKWDGVFQQQASAANNIFGWNNNQFQVVATNSTSTISFEDAGEGNNLGLLIDDVSVVCSVVPLPTDQCSNIDGIQEEVPQGYTTDDGACFPPVIYQCNLSELTIFSDSNTTVEGDPSVNVANPHTAWTANISGATWIWETSVIADPVGTTTKTFTRTFNLVDGVATATLDIATDNSYVVFLNGVDVASSSSENNHSLAEQDVITLDNLDFLYGTNTLEIVVTNWSQVNGVVDNNPAGLLYKLDLDLSSCIDLPGEDVPDPERGSLTVNKIVVGGNATTSNFALFVDSSAVVSGVATTTTVGVHSVTEITLPGYTGVFSGACDVNGNVTVSTSTAAVCVLTNTFEEDGGNNNDEDPTTGAIIVQKNVIDSQGNDISDNTSFTVQLNGSATSTFSESSNAIFTGLTPGIYTINELAFDGYVLDSISTSSIQIVAGATTTVFIVNRQDENGSGGNNDGGSSNRSSSRSSGGNGGGEVLGAATDLPGLPETGGNTNFINFINFINFVILAAFISLAVASRKFVKQS